MIGRDYRSNKLIHPSFSSAEKFISRFALLDYHRTASLANETEHSQNASSKE